MLICLLVRSAAADIWFVKPDGTGAAPTIQAAVDSSSAGDIVLLANGTYTGDGNRDIYVDKAITIISISENPELCIIDCQGSDTEYHRGFTIGSGCALQGVTITNGWHEEGGALDIGPQSTVTNCCFTGNHAWYSGGAMIVWSTWDWSVVSGCHFEGNSALWYGGAVSTPDYYMVHVRFEDCTFVANECTRGAVIYIDDDIEEWFFEIDGCTIVGNVGTSIANQGGLCPDISRTLIAYCTASALTGCAQLECCDIYGNEGGDWVGSIADQLGVNGNISEDPEFCDPDNGDLTLFDTSPCAPGNSPPGCDLIGAHPVGCANAGIDPGPAEGVTWGAVKAMYR
jgi:hypothetical protein